METQVIREMTTAELEERLEEERKQLTKLKMNHAVSPLENPNIIKDYKKTIAQMHTELRKREIEGENENIEQKEIK